MMIKNGFILLVMLFQLSSAFSQKTLKQLINEIPFEKNYYSPFYYSDNAGKKQGISIQNETKLLKTLKLEPLEFGDYFVTGKHEINNMLVLFFSKYWETEDTHFAILFDKSLNIIDRLDETAYDNAEGFLNVRSSINYNVITTSIHNIYNNPEYVSKEYSITDKGFKPVLNQMIVTNLQGVRIREEPSTNSTVVASGANLDVFNYLSTSNFDSSIKDNGKPLKDFWIKIATKDSLHQVGYVFGAFAKRHLELITNENKVIIDGISKEDFDKEIPKKNSPAIEKITDIEKIKKILKTQLIIKNPKGNDYQGTMKIKADNGKEISDNSECGITAYYPKYRYLLLECGHSSDYIVNLKNGDTDVNRIGNPDYYKPSPNNTFRLNGYYSGQSSVHFLEKNNINGAPEYMLDISSLISLDYIEKYFWTDDNTMFLKIEERYYKMTIENL